MLRRLLSQCLRCPLFGGDCTFRFYLHGTLLFWGDHHADNKGESTEVNYRGDDNVGYILVIRCEVRKLKADDIKHRHEDRGEDDSNGIVDREQRNGDSVEARRGQGLIGAPEKLSVAGEVVECRAAAGHAACDGH